MASSIAKTGRTVVPVLVHLTGYAPDKLVPSDPETKMVDVISAFKLVLGDQTAKQTVSKLLTKLKSTGPQKGPLTEEAIDLSKFSRVRWKGNKGTESIVAPMHVVLQALLMHNSKKTRGVREVAAKTTLRHMGGDPTLASETQRNNDRLAGTHEQEVLLNDTSEGTPPTAIATHTPMPAQSVDGILAIVDRIPDGPDKTALLMKAFERDAAMRDMQHKFNMDAMAAEEERRKAAMAAEEERRIVLHDKAVAESDDRLLATQERRKQNRFRSEAELSQIGLENKESLLRSTRLKLDACTDDFERAYLQGVYNMISDTPTEIKYTVNTSVPEAPSVFTQAVMSTGSGSIGELQLPVRYNVLSALSQAVLPLQTFVSNAYPMVKLTPDHLKDLGKRVANAHDNAITEGQRVKNYAVRDGERFAPRAYPLKDLVASPLKELIEVFVKDIHTKAKASGGPQKRKATTPAPGDGPTTRGSRSMDHFLKPVVGTPVPR